MSWTQQPSCFGKLWDPNTTECAGGADAAYRDKDGNHVRERCGFFEQCGATKQAGAQAAARTFIQPTQLTRFQPPYGSSPAGTSSPPPASTTPAPQQTILAAQHTQLIQQLLQQVAQLQRGVVPQGIVPQAHHPPVYHPPVGYQQMMPVNFSIPQYLTVREERAVDGTVWGMLGREIVRSMGKSFGHTLSNFFDSTPFGGPKT